MAAEMIAAVLKAEKAASDKQENAKKEAEEIIADAKKKAQEVSEIIIDQAKGEARLIVSEAEDGAKGIISQANSLALLREKKVITDTEKKYGEAIKTVLEKLV